MFKLIKIYLVLCWVGFIFILSNQPMPEYKSHIVTFYDKGVHFILFGILAYLIILAGQENKKNQLKADSLRKENFKVIALASLLISFVYAVFCEYWQVFVPGRSLSEIDLLAGSIGIVVAIFYSYVMTHSPRPKLLLHICCAGCGAYVSQLLKQDFKVSLYFYNPNIYPAGEYYRRLEETKMIANKFKLDLIVGEYDHNRWRKLIRGHESDPERGKRCWICYRDRLEATAEMAKEKRFNYFTTTLSVSPHKDAKAISMIGREVAQKYKIQFLDKDFKKENGFKRSVKLSKELGLYRQNYCGCEYSHKSTN